MRRECEHGQLARSCYICELERELARLRIRLAALEWVAEAARRNPCSSSVGPSHHGLSAASCELCEALTALERVGFKGGR